MRRDNMGDTSLTSVYRFKINHLSDIWWSAVSAHKDIRPGDIVLVVKDNRDFKKGTYAMVISIEERELTLEEISRFNKIDKLGGVQCG
jgi:hypothetical protein